MSSRIRKVVFVANGHDEVLLRWAIGTLSGALREQGFLTSLVDLARGGKERECEDADVVVVYRSFDLRTQRLMRRVRMQGPFVVFFLDDYLFQKGCKYTLEWTAPLTTMGEADALMSSSAFLLEKMPFDKPKILRRSVLDARAMAALKQSYRRKPGEFNVGWTAGRGRFGGMDRFVLEFLKELDGRMEGEERCSFKCFGSRGFPQFSKVKVSESVFFRPEDWKGLYSKLVSYDLGAMINPLDEGDDFCKAKSELKFVESGAMGVPLVTSRVPPYTEFLESGRTGMFASTPKEFAEKVLMLMRDEPLSRRMSEDAREAVLRGYDVARNAAGFVEDLERAMQATRKI